MIAVGAAMSHGNFKVAYDSDKPDTPPEFSPDIINFNGIGEHGYETFSFYRNLKNFDFCKTGRDNGNPYDLAVCVVLVLAKYHFVDLIEISSDGGATDWIQAVKLINKTFGYGDFPFSEQDIRERFIPEYAVNEVEAYRQARKELGLAG